MIYETFNLSTKNPIISNHSAYGQELLPGLAYIDLIFQFFKKHYYSYNEFELRNLSIYNPLIVGKNYDVLLTLQCSEIREGQWHIVVEGQERRNDGTVVLNKKRYVTAEMHKIGSVIFGETLDLNQIEHLAKSVGSLDEVYEQCQLQDLVHTGLMKAEGKIYEGETASFIDISLGQEAQPGAESFLFHPALIDGSAIGSRTLLSALVKGEERLFLPLFYESFRASELIQQRCLTRIQTSALVRKKELLYMTMEFFNESGKKVAELRNFISKLVRGAELINPNLKNTFQMEAANFSRSLLTSFQEPSNVENDLNLVTTAETEFFLQQLMADRLKKPIEQIETQVGYYEMGLNSPGLLEIVQEIETKIGVALSPTLLFEYTTIAELSAYLTENYPSKFRQYSAVTREVEQEMLGNATAQAPSTDSEVGNGVLSNDNTEEGRAAAMPAIEQDIAIIGMAGRYPKAINLQEFWTNLKTGKDCISEIPKSRWDWKLYEGVKSPSGKNISKWGGFIDDPDCFDPQFFRVTPREAELMDPQERLFLENCWEAIEDAGYTPKTLVMPQGPNKRHHVGVFVGVMHKDYTQIGAEAALHGQVVPLSLNYASIANRVSYFCNFHGPSMAVDTVCSSSLTAVHLALESIRHGECEVALAGGVNLSLHPNKYLTYGLMDMHSSDGYCHTFGKEGDGFVSGEGVGTVLLKPLHKAVQDGDHIYSVIKGSTINHGGTVSGMTVPSPIAQADMITACIKKAKVHPRTISYVEAQGTGTSLGDPIEIEGLAKAFRLYTQDLQYCSIGSVKSNIGHAESAGGIGALTKVALQLYYKTLVPSLHSEKLNPHIDFKQSPFFVQQETEEWKKPVLVEDGRQVIYPRRAGLNSYGATGSNAHVILEEYIPKQTRQQNLAVLSKNDSLTIIPLSAKDKERLHAYVKKLLEYLKEFPSDKNLYHGEINISELAYTLQVGRESMEDRVVFLVKDIPQLIEKLEAYGEGKEVINNCWWGDGKHSKETIDLLNDQESLDLINKWMINGKTQKIAELWVKGFAIDWNLFYRDTKPCRISLPTYPFARERYWVTENRSGSDGSNITRLKQQNGTEALKTLDTQEEIKAVPAIEQDGVQEKAANYFKKLLAPVCKLPIYRIEADVQLEQYGVDSIMGMQMIKKLEKLFGSLPKTLIFEYKTIKDLTGYFLENYRDRLTELWGIEDKAAVAAEDSQDSKNWTEPEKLAFGTRRRPLRFASLRMKPQDKKASMDIAIIGVSGRYPQAGNIQEFWNNLQGGTDCITEIPKDRWNHSLYFDEDKNKPGKTSCKWGGFIEDVDQFDPLFFNIALQEAEIMDPMTRLFLETVWNLFEDSGYTRETLEREYQSRVGVYVGAMYQQYHWFHSDIIRESAISLSSYSYLANKISHYFNLQGPSIAIDTMCSSSAIAIHMACESLIKGDCQMAIAGGVNLSIHPKKYLALSPTHLLASQINSRSFGDGDGYLPAEGVGAVLLKPLTNAIRDRDLVLAVIKSTATNHGGASAYGVPNPDIQARLIEENFIKAEINPRTISYVEAFAVGSPLGDPIEVTALNKAFQKFTTDQQFCAIGSVKSNIGHAEAASGISQLTKVVLQLQNKKLVPSIKADPLNPNINFENTPFYLQRELQEWKRPVVKIDGEEREYPRRATVSSFGGGGSNVHLIVEEYISGQEKTVHTSAATSPQIVVFSAKKRDQLQVVVEQMLEFIKLQKELILPDFAYTLQVGREAMEYRLAMVVNNREELIQGLKESLESFEEGKETEKFIPSFTGNLEVDLLNIKRLFSGNLGETMVKMLVEEKNLEKIALYWAQGGKIPWKSLHEGQEVRKISLPTYPFKKQRCWIESQPEL